jgi:hypothetical protein
MNDLFGLGCPIGAKHTFSLFFHPPQNAADSRPLLFIHHLLPNVTAFTEISTKMRMTVCTDSNILPRQALRSTLVSVYSEAT